MLTRLQVSGFKNLIEVDVRFGPFTCIAGANGVGKSNLFDAITFLSALANRPLIDAARSVRDESGRTGDFRSLFHRVGENLDKEMSFIAEMIVPQEGEDDLGQKARAGITFLRYALTLALRADDSERGPSSPEIRKEELTHINLGEARRHLLFPHYPDWRRSFVKGRRTSAYISTEEGENGERKVVMHQDGSGGRPTSRLASTLPRTVLSTAYAAENPTALLARREMQSWRLLQLEPSALRKPDEFTAPTRLGADGSHLAATLYHLARIHDHRKGSDRVVEEDGTVYAQVANRLAQLIEDIRTVWVDRDERRELFSVNVTGNDGTVHPARALSDGTLRFLALAVLEMDPDALGVICLEEPENGIHPQRIQAMLQLLRDIATDPKMSAGADNPLRQVIVNTHAPAVVLEVPDDSLLLAEWKEIIRGKEHFKGVTFRGLEGTWRTSGADAPHAISKGHLLSYLRPVAGDDHPSGENGSSTTTPSPPRRVRDRPDLAQLLIPFPGHDS
jgi:predicted ATPase